MAFAAIGVRLVDVATASRATARSRSRATPSSRAAAPRVRRAADIVDRNGVVLATSLRHRLALRRSACDPRMLDDGGQELAATLPGSQRRRAEAPTSRGQELRLAAARPDARQQQYAVNRLGMPGSSTSSATSSRVYPQGSLIAHVVGFTDVDGKGLAGIERSFDDRAHGAAREPRRALARCAHPARSCARSCSARIDRFQRHRRQRHGARRARPARSCRMVSLARFRPEAGRRRPHRRALQPHDARRLRDGLDLQDC